MTAPKVKRPLLAYYVEDDAGAARARKQEMRETYGIWDRYKNVTVGLFARSARADDIKVRIWVIVVRGDLANEETSS